MGRQLTPSSPPISSAGDLNPASPLLLLEEKGHTQARADLLRCVPNPRCRVSIRPSPWSFLILSPNSPLTSHLSSTTPSDASRCGGGLRSTNTKTLVDAPRLPLALAAVAAGNARLMMTLLSARSRKASLRRGGGASLWKVTMPATASIKTPRPRLPPTVSYTWSAYACKWTH